MPAPVLFGSVVRAATAAGQPFTGDQLYPSITGLANGGMAIGWNTANAHNVFFYNSTGVEAGAGTAIFTFSNGSLPATSSQIDLATLSDGRVVAAWSNNTVTAADTGEVQWVYLSESDGAGPVNTIVRSGYQGEVVVAPSINGRFMLVGKFDGSADLDAGRISAFNAFGAVSAGFFGTSVPATAVSSPTGIQEQPNVAALSDGRYIMAAIDRADNSIRGFFTTTFGERTGSAMELTAAGQAPSVQSEQRDAFGLTGLANGGFALSFNAGGEIKYRLFDASGVPTTALLTTTGFNTIYGSTALGLPDGRLMLISTSSASSLDIKGQMVNADGSLDGTSFFIANSALGEFVPSATLLADGRVAVAFTVLSLPGGSGYDIEYQIVDPRERGLTLSGSDGSDNYQGTPFSDLVLLGAGNDQFTGFAGTDTIYGEAGADTLLGGDGVDGLYGGNGNDSLSGDGDTDYLDGGLGGDVLNGGAGDDIATYFNPVIADLATPATNSGEAAGDSYVSIEGLSGSGAADTLRGDGNTNYLYGNNGNDLLFGQAGADYLLGGDGVDTLEGGAGADYLDGGGGVFNDFAAYALAPVGVTADLANAALNTGDAAGDAFISISGLIGSTFADALYGNESINTLIGNAGNDVLVGRGRSDSLYGGNGDDVLNGGEGADTLVGDANVDLASYADSPGGLLVDLQAPGSNTGEAAGDSFVTVEGLIGSAFGDYLLGDANANVLKGGDGDDQIYGRDGADQLEGNAGTDTLIGGFGDDQLEGGTGGDVLNGENGFDYATYLSAAAPVVADLQLPSQNGGDALNDSYAGIEGLIGSNFDDLLLGDAGTNWIFAGTGADQLYGRDGADVLIGGAGNDTLFGGTGNDSFVFSIGGGNDTISDMAAGPGVGDTIQIPSFYADYTLLLTMMTTVGGTNTLISFIGGGAGNSITILNVLPAGLSENDFVFV